MKWLRWIKEEPNQRQHSVGPRLVASHLFLDLVFNVHDQSILLVGTVSWYYIVLDFSTARLHLRQTAQYRFDETMMLYQL